jgi:hypothetical protein
MSHHSRLSYLFVCLGVLFVFWNKVFLCSSDSLCIPGLPHTLEPPASDSPMLKFTAQPKQTVWETVSWKYPVQKGAGRVAQGIDYLPSKHVALSSIPSTIKRKKKKRIRNRAGSMAQVVEPLHRKCETLCSNPSNFYTYTHTHTHLIYVNVIRRLVSTPNIQVTLHNSGKF